MLTALAALAAMVGVSSAVLSRSKLFESTRDWLLAGEGLRGFLGALVSCSFCTSIWASLAAWGALWAPWQPRSSWLFVNPLTIAAAAAPVVFVVIRSHKDA